MGKLDAVFLPDSGKRLKRGDVLFKLRIGKDKFVIPAPISGEVVDVNTSLSRNPQKIVWDPYGIGWIMKVKVNNDDLKELLQGEGVGKWMAKEIEKLFRLTGPEMGIPATDGGEISPRGLRKIERERRIALLREFLKC